MILLILNLRLRQFVRELQALGPVYTLILFAGFVLLIRLAYLSIYTIDNISILTLGWSALLLTIHAKRKDKRFLSKLRFPYHLIFLVEYFIISIPVLIIGRCFPIILVSFLIFIYLISRINIGKKQFNLSARSFSFIPPLLFEWKAGLRKLSLSLFIFIYSIAIIGLLFPYVSLVVCWIINSIICSFYQQTESRFILRSIAINSQQLVKSRIILAIKAQAILLIPIHVFYALINQDQIIISAIAYLLFMIILIFCIISKYAFYEPNQSGGPSSVYLALGQLSVFIPILIPLPIILSITWYPKAIKNLKNYFYD